MEAVVQIKQTQYHTVAKVDLLLIHVSARDKEIYLV